ncbi:MAG: hypothetical protein N0A16_05210 [Blastocatellia bacterium]|nr:hypothetical protein [Blastocatellia bacterium]MCS7157110.1 hypothetical protein [Blastocatellia bacterium]MCX7752427.1 hypothetical protein [Blastocatellia bacterium]
MRRTSQVIEDLRKWLAEIAEEQFQRHRRWLRGLAPEQERMIQKQLLPSVVDRLALACAHERLWLDSPFDVGEGANKQGLP